MTHLNEEILIRFLDDDLPHNEKITVEKHLKECSRCAAEKEKLFHEYFAEQPVDRLMKKYAATISETCEKTAECLDDNTICEYVDDVLTPEKRVAVEKHLADCNYCLNEVAELKKITDRTGLGVKEFTKEVVGDAVILAKLGVKLAEKGVIKIAKRTGASIRAFKRELQGIKCDKCGKQNSYGAAFCSSCGEKIIKVDISDIICPECNRQITPAIKECPHCGAVIIGPEKDIAKYYQIAKEWLPPALKENKWLVAAIATLLFSLAAPQIFIQFCVAAGIFGGMWIFKSVGREKIKKLYDAWKKDDKEEVDKLVEEIKKGMK